MEETNAMKQTQEVNTPKVNRYYTTNRLMLLLEDRIKGPIMNVTVNTVGYYTNDYGINSIITGITVRTPGGRKIDVKLDGLLPETAYLSLKYNDDPKKTYREGLKTQTVVISDKHSFTKRNTGETITYYNVEVLKPQ